MPDILTADRGARARVGAALDETLFVEAGAGSGKTSSLVGRFVALVEAGVAADHIAAITFTEQAARELADRIRRELAVAASEGSSACGAAIEVLDRAAICTLHSFAQRILTERPVEARLPPRFTVLDEIASEEVFERRWELAVDRMLEDPVLEMPLRVLVACGKKLEDLRDLALEFRDNWDLLQRGTPDAGPIEIDVSELCADLDAIVAMGAHCVDGDDRLLRALPALRRYRDDLAATGPADERVELLQVPTGTFSVGNVGRKASWPGCDPAEVRAMIKEADGTRIRLAAGAVNAALRRIGVHLANFTLDGAEQRRREGTLEFHDLLVLARTVLRDREHGPGVRRALAARYERLLLDEFQDTDPIQVELALLIGCDDPGAGGRPWGEISPRPGALFFVGDPKQSIYRFRRADIATFLAMRDRIPGGVERLTANFRSGRSIVGWVNATFSQLIVEQSGRQPAYVALEAQRDDAPVGPSVGLLGHEALPEGTKAPGLRQAEADAVAAAVAQVIAEGWSVATDEGWRPAGAGDVCVLVPARTSLPFLERALDAAAIPYRAETSSLVYGTTEVRDLLAVARAVDDATDQLALVSALRTAAFGCGDDDLYSWRELGGRWDHQAAQPAGAPDGHPVAAAMAWMGELHRARTWMSASEVLDTIVRERRVLETAFARPRPLDLLRRIRFVVDQARAWEETGPGGLRGYLTWVRRQSSATSRVVETVLPETDEQSVRIMTIHAAKGLEFPIVVLSGLTAKPMGRPGGVQVLWGPEGWEAKLGKGVATAAFEDIAPVEEQMDGEERRRLLYVAATRARDHLLVSVHRVAKPSTSNAEPTAAELLWSAASDTAPVRTLEARAFAAGSDGDRGVREVAPRAEWDAERAAVLERASRRLTTSATRLAEEAAMRRDATGAGDPGLAKDAPDLELPAWQKGRYGTAIGRAVHAVLQSVELTTGAGLGDAAAAQAAAEEVLGREDLVAALVRSALDAPIVRAAAARPHWREVYVGAPVGGSVLEGYIDLLVRDDDGLVIIDYKTDTVRDSGDLAAKVARYRPQLAAYAAAVEVAVGEPVVRAVLLFLAPGGAQAVVVPALADAVAEVRRDMTGGVPAGR